MNTKNINMHMHSNNSDGTKNNIDIIEECISNKLDVISLTNHDTVKGQKECIKYCQDKDIEYITGIELTGSMKDLEFHILGYNIDIDIMKELNKSFEEKRVNSSKELMNKLINKGYDLKDDFNYDKQIITLGRISESLSRQLDISKREAYKLIRETGYKHVMFSTVKEVIDMIHKSNGKAIMAHPFDCICKKTNKKISNTKEEVLKYVDNLIELGIDGIEALYYDYNVDNQQFLTNIAIEKGLMITTGTDFHGKPNRSVINNIVDTNIKGLVWNFK